MNMNDRLPITEAHPQRAYALGWVQGVFYGLFVGLGLGGVLGWFAYAARI